jgi:hypothetical protein
VSAVLRDRHPFPEELSIALEHRWKPDALFVIFTAHFDEADTHGPEPTIIMAAFLGHAYQWRRFEMKLGRLQSKHGPQRSRERIHFRS